MPLITTTITILTPLCAGQEASKPEAEGKKAEKEKAAKARQHNVITRMIYCNVI